MSNNNHPGITSFYSFINAFNTVEKSKIIKNLHFPHFTHSNSNQPVMYINGEVFWQSLKIQFDQMIKLENWSFSTLDKCKIISETDKTLQCLVEFNRRTKNKKSYGTAKGIWIATLIDNVWALQIRSMIPVSGKISSLAGTKITNGQ